MIIGLFFGGRSVEHGVSVVTAKQVYDALVAGGRSVHCIYMTESGQWLLRPSMPDLRGIAGLPLGAAAFEAEYRKGARPCRLAMDSGGLTLITKGLLPASSRLNIDLAFPATHGSHGEDGSLQGLFELLGVPFVGSGVAASAILMDKARAKEVLRAHGLPVLDGVQVPRIEWLKNGDEILKDAVGKFSYPLFVKPNDLGSSIAVSLAQSKEELAFALDVVYHFSSTALIEPAVEDAKEVNCAVLDGSPVRASVCESPIPASEVLSYEDKYLHGSKEQGMEGSSRELPADLAPETTRLVQDMAISAFNVAGASGTARVDFLLRAGETEVYINEVNTIPGSMAIYLWEASGLSSKDLVEQLIETALRTRREKDRYSYSLSRF